MSTATATPQQATERPRYYPGNWNQSESLFKHPRISARFAIDKNLWHGRRVAVRCITVGNYRRRTTSRMYYGTLDLTLGDANQIGIRHTDGQVSILHKTKAVDVYDLTREKTTRG